MNAVTVEVETAMAGTDKRKQSLYFTDDILSEIMTEAIRLDRSLSWMVQRAWRVASEEVRKFPSVDHLVAEPRAAPRTATDRPARALENRPVSATEGQPGSQVREFLSGKFENNWP
jgi:uncharacterized small protein (TIGR04563 family)